jgi:hypothetical protein
MTPPRIYTAKRRSLQSHDNNNNALPDAPTNTITVASDYGSDIEIDTDLLAVSAEAKVRVGELGDAYSDYGSDFDVEGEAILEDLLGELEGRPGGDRIEEEDGRDVAFVLPRSAESSTTYFSCESRVVGGEGVCEEGESQEEARGGGGTDFTRKFVVLEGVGEIKTDELTFSVQVLGIVFMRRRIMRDLM